MSWHSTDIHYPRNSAASLATTEVWFGILAQAAALTASQPIQVQQLSNWSLLVLKAEPTILPARCILLVTALVSSRVSGSEEMAPRAPTPTLDGSVRCDATLDARTNSNTIRALFGVVL